MTVTLLQRAMTAAEAAAVATWTYPPPHERHGHAGLAAALFRTRGPDGDGYSPAVDETGAVVAFCVLGAEARVAGQVAQPGTVDVGLGVRPGATDRGVGTALLAQAVALARSRPGVHRVRAVVAADDPRARALCARAGLTPVRELPDPGSLRFLEVDLTAPWLRDVAPDDEELYLRLRTDAGMMAELGGPQHPDRVRAQLVRDVSAVATGAARVLVVETAAGVAAGTVTLVPDEHGPGLEIGWMVLPEHQGRGLATAAVRRLLGSVPAAEGPVNAYPPTTNTPSNRLAAAAGLTLVGPRDVVFAGRVVRTNHWRRA